MSSRKTGFPDFLAKLGVRKTNPRQSWGAADHIKHRVFLFVWQHNTRRIGDGRFMEIVGDGNSQSLGRAERDYHVELIKDGYTPYLITQKAVDKKANPKEVEWYSDRLSTCGDMVVQDGCRFIELVGKVDADALSSRAWQA